MTSAARKSSSHEYFVSSTARALGFTDEFLARATRHGKVESPTLKPRHGRRCERGRTGVGAPMFGKDGDEPGAGNAGAHRIRKEGDGGSNTPNQPLTQIPSSHAHVAAHAILNKALSLGIAFGTDGDELVMLAPLKVPRDVRRWFEHWLNEFKSEAIDIILADHNGRAVMSYRYDKTLHRDLIEIFGNAVNDLTAYGGREVVDAAKDCLITAMHQDLRRFVPPNSAEALTEVFAREVKRAVKRVRAVHTAPSHGLSACDDEYADMIDDHLMRGAHDDETD